MDAVCLWETVRPEQVHCSGYHGRRLSWRYDARSGSTWIGMLDSSQGAGELP